MEKKCETSARQLGERTKTFRVIYRQPIIIPSNPEPAEETPLPADNAGWPRLILIGGSVLALLCAWHIGPDQIGTLCNNIIQQIFQFAGR